MEHPQEVKCPMKKDKSFRPDRVLSYFRVEWFPLLLVTLSGLVYNIGLLAAPWFEGRLAQCLADILGGSETAAQMALLVLAYARTYGLPVTVSRCSNNYGPYHFPEKLIPLMITRALADQSLPVYGTGENVRDWLYVEDHCAAIDLILRRGTAGEVYNIGGHNERTNLQVVQAVLAALGKPESLITFVTDRPGHDRRYAIDPTKIHRELGWQPETDFDTGLRRTVEWYLTHRDWWSHILSGEYQNYFQAMYRERLGE